MLLFFLCNNLKKEGDSMSFKSFVDDIADGIGNAVRKFTNSNIPTNIGKVGGKVVGKTIKVAGNTAIGATAQGAKGALWVTEHTDDIKNLGKATWNGTKKFVGAVDDVLQKAHLIKEVPYEKSLLGRKVTKGGLLLAGGIGVGIGMAKGTKEQIINRQGSNDGRIYKPTPAMVNPYQLSSQIANGASMGNAYANNAGATGDLVFALHNNRHG